MKKALILGIIAIGLAVFAYFWLFSADESDLIRTTNDSQSTEEMATNLETADENSVPENGVGTLEELRMLGQDIECSITYETDEYDQPVEGTYFVSNGDIRGDFLTPSPDLSGQMLSSMIVANEMMYVWSEIEGESYGMKMDLSMFDEEEAESSEPVSLDEDVQYECKEWENVDRTVFLPPGDVLFQDFGTMIQSGMEYGTVYDEGEMIVPEY